MSARRQLKLAIASSLENVPLVGTAVNALCRLVPLSELDAYQAELCVVEACTNAIKHAYNHEDRHTVYVEATLGMEYIEFRVRDRGQAMPELPRPELDYDPHNLEALPEGGMGLFIMYSVMDSVTYETDGQDNTLILRRHFNRQNAKAGRFKREKPSAS